MKKQQEVIQLTSAEDIGRLRRELENGEKRIVTSFEYEEATYIVTEKL